MNKTILAQNGKTDWSLVVKQNTEPQVEFAAREFVSLFREITGSEIPVRREGENVSGSRILLGFGADVCDLGTEGIVIEIGESKIVLTGGLPRGVIYSVYTFFEDYAGCRWFASDCAHIPKKAEFTVPVLSRRAKPCFEFRDSFFKDAFDWRFAARNKLNGASCVLLEEQGGHVEYGVSFVHTFNLLVPRDEYFQSHPEYFPEINGKRVTGPHHQLCLTNPDVLAITIDKVRAAFRANPQALIASVSQDDTYPEAGNNCECASCRAIDEEEGTPMGSVLRFVNAVAEAVEDEFPDRWIDTLAYRYTRRAPKITKPRSNVLIRLCSIECCFSHTFEGCDQLVDGESRNGSFVRDMEEWRAIAPNLFVWDYVVNFDHYLLPYPNLHTLGENMRFFRRYNVRGMFSQGCYNATHGEIAELRAYVLAKLLWDPDYDVDLATGEFLSGYFGTAGAPIGAYIKELGDRAQTGNFHHSLIDAPDPGFFSPDFLARADVLFDRAEALAADQTALDRVQRYRMSVRYAKLCVEKGPKAEKKRLSDEFFADMERLGISSFIEWGDFEASRGTAEKRFGA